MRPGQRPPEDPPESARSSTARRIVVPNARAREETDAPAVRFGRVSNQRQAETPQPPETVGADTMRRGFRLGGAKSSAKAQSPETLKKSRKWTYILAAGALLLLLLSTYFSSSGDSGVGLTPDDRSCLAKYHNYLSKQEPHLKESDINLQIKMAEDGIKAYRWDKAVGENARAEEELKKLLLMDKTTQSPLYDYCMNTLRKG